MPTRSPYKVFRDQFPSLVKPLRDAGVTVINCSRATALTVFPTRDLETALQQSREVAA
jgi:hypothetical protein